ncbi:dihydroneopterin aldolase [Desulforamulus aquiferis]|uniref:7,8-dihydroneopterin aldolase n=1 Tax=Desulforamulus aquiferis TaxID=1397668 RepID=A0AAW7ZGZ9_9FIRM|nr:dihydroneopterin aldolase [Desulforamulus aquiferis]MDO7788972.1 dihydroneopterin aldolase [Desulforamulus aquiferis]
MTDKIILAGMEFFGFHGVFEEERRLGQKFQVDLVLYLDLAPAGCSDNIEQSVSYAEVFELVKGVMTGKSLNLLEALAEEISKVVLASLPLVEGLKVVVKKPGAPIPGNFEYMAVEINRKRI